MLATAPEGTRTRAWLQDMLWGRSGHEHGRASLRRALTDLRGLFGEDFNEPQTSAVGPLAFANVPAKLFPNPAAQTTVLEFNCHHAQLASLDILDALGKVVTQRTIALNPGTNKIDLDVSSLEQGTYMVQVQGDAELHISERLLVSER